MTVSFSRINYEKTNSRQKEIYNFQKVSGLLADYGYATYRLIDDWNGADFLAVHFDGISLLRVQLKGRLTFDRKYEGKDIWICFRERGLVYLYPHDELLKKVLGVTKISNTDSWKIRNGYSFPRIPGKLKQVLNSYLLGHESQPEG